MQIVYNPKIVYVMPLREWNALSVKLQKWYMRGFHDGDVLAFRSGLYTCYKILKNGELVDVNPE